MRDWFRIAFEAEAAEFKYGEFRSTHEGLGVLMEEVHELIDAIRSNDLAAIGREAMQVSAVAGRLYHQCEKPSDDFAERSR